MKVENLLKIAMLEKDVADAGALAELSGVTYGTTIRALKGDNVGIVVIVKLLNSMGYQLKAELIK